MKNRPSTLYPNSAASRFSVGRLLSALLFLLQPAGSGVLVAAGAPSAPSPMAASLKSVSYENHRLRIRLDRPGPYRVFSLMKPPRLVVELSQTVHAEKPYVTTVDDDILKKIRSAQFTMSPQKVTRVVLEMPKLAAY